MQRPMINDGANKRGFHAVIVRRNLVCTTTERTAAPCMLKALTLRWDNACMKSLWLILVLFAVTLSVHAQGGFTTVVPDSPVNMQLSGSDVFVSGHWVALDKSELAGPAVSEIHCDRQMCHESQANITVFKDGTFTMTTGYVEYQVERWNKNEIVAKNVSGICRTLNVIKFDLVQKKVYSMQTLSEPTNDLSQMSKKICAMAGMNLELKDIAVWKRQN